MGNIAQEAPQQHITLERESGSSVPLARPMIPLRHVVRPTSVGTNPSRLRIQTQQQQLFRDPGVGGV